MDLITYALSKKYTNKIAETLAGGLKYQGSVETASKLPKASSSNKGHMYTATDNGHEYVSDGSTWIDLSKDLDNKADKTALETEVNNRTTADTNLQNNITDEVNNRTTADNNLSESINQEAITREQADNTLTADLATEVSNRITADTTLENNKQDKLIAGSNIIIGEDGKTISAVNTEYTAGDGITINDHEIKVTYGKYVERATETTADRLIAYQDNTGLQKQINVVWDSSDGSLTTSEFKATTVGGGEGKLTATKLSDGTNTSNVADVLSGAALGATALQEHQDISGKQDKLIAGENIVIAEDGKTISAPNNAYRKSADQDIIDNAIKDTVLTETTNRETADDALDERLKKFELPAEPELVVIGANNYLFANGVSIRIEDNTTENIAYYCTADGVQKSITFPYQSIVHGGGLGTATKSANISSTFVTINGGKVKSIYGGSRDYGNVGTATIIVNGGTLKEGVQGGGGAATAEIANAVGIANITFNGGSSLATYGGGMGLATVGRVNMTVNGGTHQWVTAGGANGTTGIANVLVTGGNITCLQAVNRGIVQDVTIIIRGGSITNVYGGGETGDSSVTGKCERTILHIEKAFTGHLNKGTYGGVEDASRVSGDYIANTVTTAEATNCNLTLKADISEKQDKLVSGTNIKTINSNSLLGSGNIEVKTFQPFPSDFKTDGTLSEFVDSINGYSGGVAGMGYLGEIENEVCPWGFGNAECKVEYLADGIALVTCSSSNIAPNYWVLNTWEGCWRGVQGQLTASTGIDIDSDNKIKATGVEYKNNGTTQTNALKFIRLTKAEYEALSTKDADTLYIIIG